MGDPLGTAENVSGSSNCPQWPTGQAMTTALPTTESMGTVPLNWAVFESSAWWARESAEFSRWSPMTQSRPWGTVTWNSWVEGLLPGWT